MRSPDFSIRRLGHNTSSPPVTTTPAKSRMPTVFNVIRGSLYIAIFLCTIICLAMAAQFQHVLAASDLTRFVPFSLFVCSASLLAFAILLGFSTFLKERNPISTRAELASLGLMSIFWLVLGVFLAASESQDADVQCYETETSTEPLDDSASTFHTEQFQAMYRVLNAFSLINAVIVIFAFLSLLFLAVRRHRAGDQHMWHAPVTHCAWFNLYTKTGGAKKNQQSSNNDPILPIAGRHTRHHSRGHSTRHNKRDKYTVYPSMKEKRGRSGSGQSSLIGSTIDDFNNGGMVNPNRTAPPRR